jgi:hypothetical protein
VADVTAISAVALAIPAAAVGRDMGKIPTILSAVASAVDAGVIPAVALAIPAAAVGGDARKIPMVALAMYAAADAEAISAVASAIPAAAVGGDAGKIPTVALATYATANAATIPAVALAIFAAAVGGEAGKFPMVALAMYAAADAAAIFTVALAIPAAAVGGDAGSESIVAEDDTISGDGIDKTPRNLLLLINCGWESGSDCDLMMPTMTWEDDSTVGDGGDVEDDADSFSGFLDPRWRFVVTNKSVHYHHQSGSHLLSDGYSCHGRVEQVNLNENLSRSVSVSVSSIIPPWVHVFAKSTQSSSLRTQAASIAYIEEPLPKKA